MLRESDFQKRVRIIIRRRILRWTKGMPPCIFETTLRYYLLGLFLFCGSTFFFSLLFCSLLTTAKTCASLNPRCGTCPLVCSDEGRRFRFAMPIVDHG